MTLNKRSSSRLQLYLVLAFCGLFLLAPRHHVRAQDSVTYRFDPRSRIWVEGTSTLHDWTCEVKTFDGNVTVGDAERPPERINSATLTVAVDEMECGKSKMNSKLRDAFNVSRHPRIVFEAQKITPVSSAPGTGAAARFLVSGTLSMAGTGRTIEVAVDGSVETDGRLKFTGQYALDMTDYGMDPPTALLGTIRTGERVVVHFEVWTGNE